MYSHRVKKNKIIYIKKEEKKRLVDTCNSGTCVVHVNYRELQECCMENELFSFISKFPDHSSKKLLVNFNLFLNSIPIK